MVIKVLLQVVHVLLLVVTEVADAHGKLRTDGIEQGQLLAEVGCRNEGRGHDVMVVVAQGEQLVIRLSIIGTEDDTDQWQVGLIAQHCRVAEEPEGIGSLCRRHDLKPQTPLNGIISVAGVVYHAGTDVRQCSSMDLEGVARGGKTVIVPEVELIHPLQQRGIVGTIFRRGAMQLVLPLPAPSAAVLESLAGSHKREPHAVELLLREIGIEDIRHANAHLIVGLGNRGQGREKYVEEEDEFNAHSSLSCGCASSAAYATECAVHCLECKFTAFSLNGKRKV